MGKQIQKVKDAAIRQAIRLILRRLSRASVRDTLRLANLFEKISSPKHKYVFYRIKKALGERDPQALTILRLLNNCHKNYIDKMAMSLLANGFLIGKRKRDAFAKKGIKSPTTVLISPTMRCNLRCKGCYAANYKKQDDLPFEVIDRVITEAKQMGVIFFSMLGGEPFIRKDMFKIYRKHSDAFFQAYTNSTLIDEKVAKTLLSLGNVVPMLSLEGFEKETNSRRGVNIYQSVMRTADLLKKYKIPFGYSVVVTRKNYKTVMGDKFVDMMIKKGAFIGWYFLYMPVSGKPDLKMMPAPKQRMHLLERGKYIRKHKSIFIIDFWNDAPFVGGCIAGKEYVHITSSGDVEPCIFTHFAVDNVKTKSFKKIMQSDFFKELRKRQPHNDNLYLPCMLIDNPQVMRELHSQFKLKPTHPGAESLVNSLKPDINKYSKEVQRIYKKPWQENKHKYQRIIDRVNRDKAMLSKHQESRGCI